MSKSKKILLGLFSFAPLVLFGVYLISFIRFIFLVFQQEANNGRAEDVIFGDMGNVAGMIISAILLGLLSLAALAYFIVHAINNTQINRDERMIWVIVFIFIGIICFPVYWYMRIWKDNSTAMTPPITS